MLPVRELQVLARQASHRFHVVDGRTVDYGMWTIQSSGDEAKILWGPYPVASTPMDAETVTDHIEQLYVSCRLAYWDAQHAREWVLRAWTANRVNGCAKLADIVEYDPTSILFTPGAVPAPKYHVLYSYAFARLASDRALDVPGGRIVLETATGHAATGASLVWGTERAYQLPVLWVPAYGGGGYFSRMCIVR